LPSTSNIRSIEEACLLLGVYPDTTDDDLKKAYRKKALQVHPDRNDAPDAHSKFLLITQAYAILSDVELRKKFSKSNIQKAPLNESSEETIIKRGHRTYTQPEFEERLKWAKNVAKEKANLHIPQFSEIKQTLLYKSHKWVAILFIIIGTITLIDNFWTYNEERRIGQTWKGDKYTYILLSDDLGFLPMFTHKLPVKLERGDYVNIKRTKILGQVKWFNLRKNGIVKDHRYMNFLNIHIILIFIVIVMILLPTAGLISHGPRPAFYFFMKLNLWLPLFTLLSMTTVMLIIYL
jgi:hypothetical protein